MNQELKVGDWVHMYGSIQAIERDGTDQEDPLCVFDMDTCDAQIKIIRPDGSLIVNYDGSLWRVHPKQCEKIKNKEHKWECRDCGDDTPGVNEYCQAEDPETNP